MTRDELNHEYFEWMLQLVYSERYSKRRSYRRLLTHLYEKEFVYILYMDENRYADGIDLRYRFAYELNYPRSIITRYFGNCPCSVLEMMIALSLRCEEHIMDDPDIGNRTDQWFWGMIENLGLASMTDSAFDEEYTDDIISRLLNRDYEPDGEGGLFTVKDCPKDLRTVDIWYQLMWYLNSIIE